MIISKFYKHYLKKNPPKPSWFELKYDLLINTRLLLVLLTLLRLDPVFVFELDNELFLILLLLLALLDDEAIGDVVDAADDTDEVDEDIDELIVLLLLLQVLLLLNELTKFGLLLLLFKIWLFKLSNKGFE